MRRRWRWCSPGFGLEAGGEIEDVAADWVGYVDGGGGVGEFSGIARGLEMVEDSVAEHCLSIPSAYGSGKWMFIRVKKA
jgi:hypothetical protein